MWAGGQGWRGIGQGIGLGFVWVAVFCMQARGQAAASTAPERVLGVQLHRGYVVAHSDVVANIEAHATAIELLYGLKGSRKHGWEALYRGPRYGLALLGIDFGLPHLTGRAMAVLPHFEYAAWRHKRGQLSFRLGAGIGYFTHTFWANSNRRNRAIATRLNGGVQLFWCYHHRVAQAGWASRLELSAGLGITHFSNGNSQDPNWGINTLSVYAGLRLLQPQPAVAAAAAWPKLRPQWRFLVAAAGGNKQSGYVRGERFPVAVLSAEAGRQHSHRSQWMLGLEATFHPYLSSVADGGNSGSPDTLRAAGSRSLPNVLQVGYKLGHEIRMGNLGVVLQVGSYIYNPAWHEGPIYTRIGLRGYFHKGRWVAQVNLKSHLSVADFIDWGFGIVLPYRAR